jgi:ribonuclease VapC
MIVVDSSALVAFIKGESDSGAFADIFLSEECGVGAPSLVETRMWCAVNLKDRRSTWLDSFLGRETLAVLPLSQAMADIASQAFLDFGRGSGHPARLNFGDCMAYAVSVALRAPLLFKGANFGQTT